MLDFRIHTFITVCQTMNYTKAAELLHITQPAVSQHIKYLENYYQTSLFGYEGKRLFLTPQGEYLLRAMQTLSHDESILKSNLQSITIKPKQLRMGATMTIGEFDINHKVISFIKKHPELSLTYHIDDTKVLLEGLDNGIYDFIVIEGNFNRDDYDFFLYKNESFVPVCSNNYFTNQTITRIENLLEYPLLVREKGSGTREILEHYLHQYNLKIDDFKKVIEINNMNIIRDAVKDGCGITFLYETIVHKQLERKQICKIPLVNCNITHDFTFLWAKGSIHRDWFLNICNEFISN